MKYLKPAVLSSILAAAACLSGCSGYDTEYKGPGVVAEPAHNFLGIVTVSPNSFRYVEEEGTLSIHTDELWCRRDFSGTNVSLLWGLVNIMDY